MILGTDTSGNVLLVCAGTDPSKMPTSLNGVALTATVLTDAEEAAYLVLPANRAGTTFIAGNLTTIPTPPNTSPDGNGFEQAIKSGVGGVLAANALAVVYPLFFAAVEKGNWLDVQTLVLDANAKAVLSPTQYTQFQAAAITFRIPIVLP
jgi:hypothetical protein